MSVPIDTLGRAARQRGCYLRVRCPCGRGARFSPHDLIGRLGPDRRLAAIGFRCLTCGRQRLRAAPLDSGIESQAALSTSAVNDRKPLVLNTLGAIIDGRNSIAAHCNRSGCRHSADLDLLALADRLGRDHGCLHRDLAPKLRCSKCGAKQISLVCLPDYGKMGGRGSTRHAE